MEQEFSGKRVIVAGGSKGIGRAIAIGFAKAGADVSICARGADALQRTQADLAAHGHRVHAARCDLGEKTDIERYIADAAAALGGVDVLVNNASGFGYADDEESWAMCLNVDILATVRASRAALPELKKNRGAIVNLSSIAAYRASTRTPAYGAAKALLIHYTSSQAAMLAREHVRVNAVAPGSIEFPDGIWEHRRRETPDLYDRTLKSIPFGRLGHPEEIADAVLFLASPRARWVTGQTLIVDGGQLLGA